MAFRLESKKMWKEKKQGEKTKVGKKIRDRRERMEKQRKRKVNASKNLTLK